MTTTPGPDRISVVSCDGLEVPISDANRDRFQVTVNQSTTQAQLERVLAEGAANVLVVRSSTPVPADLLQKHADAIRGTLTMVVRAGVGTDSIAVEQLEELGVKVATTPDANRKYTAMRTVDAVRFCIMQPFERSPGQVELIAKKQTQQKKWKKIPWDADANVRNSLYPNTVAGYQVGVVGAGAIGMSVAEQLKADHSQVRVFGRDPQKVRDAGFVAAYSIEELAAECDVVTVHVSGNPSSHNLVGARFFDSIGTDRQLSLINMSRGSVVDERELLKALRDCTIDTSVLDVLTVEGQQLFEPDTTNADYVRAILTPLILHGKVFLTHHSGAATPDALKENSLACGKLIEAEFCS